MEKEEAMEGGCAVSKHDAKLFFSFFFFSTGTDRLPFENWRKDTITTSIVQHHKHALLPLCQIRLSCSDLYRQARNNA